MSVTPPLVIRVQVVHVAVLMIQIMVDHLPIPFTIEQNQKDSQVNHVLLVGDQVAETTLIAKQPVQLPPKMLALVMQQWANSIGNF